MSFTVRKGKTFVAATIAAAGLVAAAPSFAAEDDLTIRFKSYMLDSKAAAADLYTNIEGKVASYCETAGFRSLADRRIEAACVETMLDRTVASIDHPRLTSIHEDSVGNDSVAP